MTIGSGPVSADPHRSALRIVGRSSSCATMVQGTCGEVSGRAGAKGPLWHAAGRLTRG
jgi:hypothetical protein